MIKPRLVPLLLLSSVLTPSMAFAQDSNAPAPTTGEDVAEPAADAQDTAPDISIPGGAIIVTGRRILNTERISPQVVSVLSSEDIARTGEGDIAGALTRVTGLSVVGNGYVYVRGLGDRYSLALLNGGPLPSPEPLKRVVPLDLFPTSIIASSLVQKSYSANFPGEFGGGVINLTTKSIPDESFLEFGSGIGWDTETTNKLSYSYYGSKTDWTGYDNGNRSYPAALQDLFDSNEVLDATSAQAQAVGETLFNSRNSVVQKINHTQPNFSASLTGGTSFDMGGATLGVIAAGSYSNKTQTRDIQRQFTASTTAAYDELSQDYQTVQTDNRIVTSGMLGIGLEWGENSIRWANVYIHDTDKHTSLSSGKQPLNGATRDYIDTRTAWYERQLFDSQITGEFKPTDDTTIDVRAGYANSKRLAPFEITTQYVRLDESVTNSTAGYYVNYLGNQYGDPTTASFSRLNENVWSAGTDVTHEFSTDWSATVGYAYQINSRTNMQRRFDVYGSGTDLDEFGLLRVDVLLQPSMWYLQDYSDVSGVDFNLQLRDQTANVGNFQSRLLNHAFYTKIDGQITNDLSIDLGVRWEWAKEQTQLFPVGQDANDPTTLINEYFLPALTITYEFEPGLQARLSASKTIARPQFRELLFQTFFDPDSNRSYRGNPYLQDSQLYNFEGRVEWYFTNQEHVSLGAFFKRIDNPIETYLTGTNSFITSYANAPSANLYGAELEAEKRFDVTGSRQLVISGNYSFTKSELNVKEGDTTQIYGATTTQYASTYFEDGAPLTGQSKHIGNLQIGLEDQDSLSQQTLLINYASKRVVSRGFAGTPRQPDVYEDPGLTIDLVLRQGISLGGDKGFEIKLEGRNLTGRRHEEYQQFEDGRLEINTYKVGRVFSASASIKF